MHHLRRLIFLGIIVVNPLLELAGPLHSETWGAQSVHDAPRSPRSHPPVRVIEEVLGRRMPDYPRTRKLALHLSWLCANHDFPPEWVLALIDAESGFQVRAKSPMGARGLLQLMPGTARFIAERTGYRHYRGPRDLNNPFVNLTLGIRYLSYLRERYPRHTHLLAAYNLGPGKFERLTPEPALQIESVRRYIERINRGAAEPHGPRTPSINCPG